MDRPTRIELFDLGSGSAAFVVLQHQAGRVNIGLGIESDGDLDLLVTLEDARQLGKALLAIASDDD